MPVPDPRTGTLYVWIATCFVFTCLVIGGTLLTMYLLTPESETTIWYPVTGLVFLSLPFVFWSLTYAYIILSRSLGFRFGSNGMGKSSSPSAVAAGDGSGNDNGTMDVVVDNDSKTSHESEKPLAVSMAS